MTDTDEKQLFGRCVTEGCGETFATREEMQAHASATLEQAKLDDPNWFESGSVSGHRYEQMQFSEEETEKKRVDRLIRSALESHIDSAMEDLAALVDDEKLTKEQVTEQVKWWDLSDAWQNTLDEWE